MLREFFSYYRPWIGLFWLDFGAAVVAGMLELAFPLAVTGFIDHLLPQGNLRLTVFAAIGLMLIYTVSAGLISIVTYWGHMLGINIETEMRRRAFAHLQSLSWSYYDKQRTGRLVSLVTRDLEEIGEVAHHGPEDLFIAIMTFVGAFALMLWINVELALLSALIVPLSVVLTTVAGGKLTRTWRAIYARVGNFNVRLEENLTGIRVVQSFANEEHENGLFAKDNHGYRKTKLEAYRVMAASVSIQYLGMRAVQVTIMVVGAYMVMQDTLTTGGFVGFLLLVGVFFRPLDKIASVIESYPRGIAGFRRYLELLDTKADIADLPNAQPAPTLRGDIRFNSVTFAYGNDGDVLRDIHLDIKAGETVAFVGPSGAGKTTLLTLIPRFYEVDSGEISIDGIALQDFTLNSLRQQVGMVSQDVLLFGGTLRENIAYAKLDASEEEILEAAHSAMLDSTIENMPEGLDTIVGERGLRLSGGQKQRVAIARAFLRNPSILILDEATSALDTETEREIQAALSKLCAGRTTLIIAHRLGTIRHADRIVVMEEGRITEIGNHEELLEIGGRYSKLQAASGLDRVY
ncbi:ABC transporter ATP-binding protein [Granulosicoccus antarcticus]|uniref:Multidrug export ATP-binding/permease protein n=1 Tax=Granulosicoccus antarcticus IMCC3135 TaxID=1192854 RepID=A0A2Z2NQW2_9GAMM|nr:ABC transporter ATP-binding protein [Granulosicoccus antarcticus]ASJ73802.1 Putative multidrug export ATP-binding/permease protein [Granulosicoccus antarcticus IMCC3135]